MIKDAGCISLNSQDTSCSVSTTGSSSNNLEQTIIIIGPDVLAALRQGKYGCWHAVLCLRNVVWLAFMRLPRNTETQGAVFPYGSAEQITKPCVLKTFFLHTSDNDIQLSS